MKSRGKLVGSMLLAAACAFCLAVPAGAVTVTFDFDTGTPPLHPTMPLPVDQTTGGVYGHFWSPGYAGFSIQSDNTTFYHMPSFSGNYVWPNSINQDVLDVRFVPDLNYISVTFATIDYQDNAEVPSNVRLTAYENSVPVGSVVAHGTYGGESYPVGQLTFSTTQPFNSVEIGIVPGQPQGTPAFMADNVIVTTVPTTSVPSGMQPSLGFLTATPNPTSGATGLSFALPAASMVHVVVYDIAGRQVRGILASPMTAGTHATIWDGRDERGAPVPTGAYYIRLEAAGTRLGCRTVIIR